MMFMHFTNDHFVHNPKDPFDASKNNNRKLELFLKMILSKNVSASILPSHQRCISNKFQTAINAPIHGQAKSVSMLEQQKKTEAHTSSKSSCRSKNNPLLTTQHVCMRIIYKKLNTDSTFICLRIVKWSRHYKFIKRIFGVEER